MEFEQTPESSLANRDSRVDGRPEFLHSRSATRELGIGFGGIAEHACGVARVCRPQRRWWCRSRARRPSWLESGSGAPVPRKVARWADSPRSFEIVLPGSANPSRASPT